MKPVRIPASNPAKLVRAMMTTFGSGAYLFNDRLKDGRRSIKVWGWTQDEWRVAINILRAHGFTVAIRYRGYLHLGDVYRIWVGKN